MPTEDSTSVPVLLIIFNRPDTVQKLIESLAAVKPSVVYIAADGPRAHVPDDVEKCSAARAAAQTISWPCTVKILFSDVNLGVDPAVEAGISWFFENETEGIILEDDCIPHPDFFTFAGDMLARYRDTPQVMMISGNNFQKGVKRGDGSYYFSRYANTWGWATWRRAWNLYDTKLSALPEFIERNGVSTIRPHADEQAHWLRYFKRLASGERTPWDAKWIFTLWAHDGLSVVPNKNLVENVGFGKDATHTVADSSLGLTAVSFPAPYITPSVLMANEDADRYLFTTIYKATLWKRIRHVLSMVR